MSGCSISKPTSLRAISAEGAGTMSVDAAIARIENELPTWGWSVFSRAEEYQAHLWDGADLPPGEGAEVYVNADTPAEALPRALESAKAGRLHVRS